MNTLNGECLGMSNDIEREAFEKWLKRKVWFDGLNVKLDDLHKVEDAFYSGMRAARAQGGEVAALQKVTYEDGVADLVHMDGRQLVDYPDGTLFYTHPSAGAVPEEWRQTLERIAHYPRTRDQELSAPAMRQMARDALTAAPTAPAASCACDESGMCKFHGDRAEKFRHPHNAAPTEREERGHE